MSINLKRDEIQKQALAAFEKSKSGVLHISMGVGKTLIGIRAAKNKKAVLIVCPYTSNIKTWKEEYKLWLFSDKHVTYTTTKSLKKYSLNKYDLVICDEIHLFSESQLLAIPNAPILGLSGTLSNKTRLLLKTVKNLDVIYDYPLEQAVNDGIITDYKISIVKVPLDSTNAYIDGGSKFKPFKTTELNQYQYLTKKFEELKIAEAFSLTSNERSKYRKIKLSIASKRARLLYSCKSKLNIAKKLINKFSEDRLLVFSTLTESANYLCENQYHSKADKANLDRFSSGIINQLAVVNMANTGLNIKPLHKAIVHQFQSSEETAQQRMGRLLRLEYNNPNKVAEIWVTVCENTVDEDWVKNALINIPESKIQYVDYRTI